MLANSRNAEGRVLTNLADLPPAAILDETALAAALKCSKRTLRRMVGRHEVPPSIRLAGRSSWQAGRVLAWVNARAERAESEAEISAARMPRNRPSHLA
jgi:predicted DNA-binding transcriptional regulator AlpA